MSRSEAEYLLHIKDELDFLESNSVDLNYNSFIENEVLKRAFLKKSGNNWRSGKEFI